MPHSTNSSGDLTSTAHSLRRLASYSADSTTITKPSGPASLVKTSPPQRLPKGRSNHLPTSGLNACNSQPDPLGDQNSMPTHRDVASKRRSFICEDEIRSKENDYSSARERIQRESPIVAELRTNVIIKDEYTLVTDLSYHLAARYTRPDSAIMVRIDHSACLALGGTFDPCYILHITAVPSQMSPTMNKRNAGLIQSFMADVLSVPAERGIIKFSPILEENFAINGLTMLGDIEQQERQKWSDNGGRQLTTTGWKGTSASKTSALKLDHARSSPSGSETSQVRADSKEPARRESETIVVTGLIHTAESKGDVKIPAPSSAAMIPRIDVFELPAVELEQGRSSSSHRCSMSIGSNGRRLNGTSDGTADLSFPDPDARKSRPRTLPSATPVRQSVDSVGRKGVRLGEGRIRTPPRQSPVPLVKSDRPPSFLKMDPAKLMSKSSRASSASRSSSQPPADENRPRPRDSYIDGLMGTPTTTKKPAATPSDRAGKMSEDRSQHLAEQGGQGEQAANTAKRRSTINTVPLLEPPQIPTEIYDSKSTKSLKVGKRKSFLTAFRRSPTNTNTNNTTTTTTMEKR